MRPATSAVGTALAVLALAACPAADDGTANAPRPRVVSLAPAATSIIVALGEADHLVGVTTFCDFDGAPRVGDMRPAPERVLARRPDLVVAGAYPYNRPVLDGLRAQKLTVLALPLTTIAELRAAIGHLGERLGATARAGEMVAALDRALDGARAAARRRAHPIRVLLVFGISGGHVFTTGGGDHLSDVLAAVDATNVVAGGGPVTTRVPLERVLALAPDLILHTAPTPRFPSEVEARQFWQTMPTVPAVERGQIHVWPDGTLAQNGPPLAAAVERLTALLARAP